jgi:hypothetical protein
LREFQLQSIYLKLNLNYTLLSSSFDKLIRLFSLSSVTNRDRALYNLSDEELPLSNKIGLGSNED